MNEKFFYDATVDMAGDPRVLLGTALKAGHRLNRYAHHQETLNRTLPALARPMLKKLIVEANRGSTLICLSLDQCGHDAGDIRATVEKMRRCGIGLICLQVDNMIDLTGPAGDPIMKAIAACAEAVSAAKGARIRRGQVRAAKAGGSVGRSVELTELQIACIVELIGAGNSISSVSQDMGVTRQSIYRLLDREGVPRPAKQNAA